jgi:hypothetical protein
MCSVYLSPKEASMTEWKFLTNQRVRVKRSVEIVPPGEVPELNELMEHDDIPVRLPPPDEVLGKTGTILTRVQPVWTSDVPQGNEVLHQYEVDIDGVGATLIIEEWLEPAEQ